MPNSNNNETIHNLSSKDLCKLLVSDDVDDIIEAIVSSKNINDEFFNVLTNPKKVKIFNNNSRVYKLFYDNEAFKKEWIFDFIKFISSNTTYSFYLMQPLENEKFFASDTEWLTLYKFIMNHTNIVSDKIWETFWYNFFKYPKKNYSEEIILQIFSDFGQKFATCKENNDIFSAVFDNNMTTDKILKLFVQLTKDKKFLSSKMKNLLFL
jgi:hypothetical protein